MSYSEVLAATKHQDDKLARSLTAVAFLTAAGVAIFNSVRTDVSPVLLDGQSLPAQAFFFMVFLVAVVFAVAASLAAIGPTTHYGEGGGTWKSLLFYAQIARDDRWKTYIDDSPDELRKTLAQNFHSETQFIASRVPYKMARSREAAAFITLAAMSLSLLGIFSIGSITPETRWWIAAGVLFAFSVMPFFDLFQMRLFRFIKDPGVPSQYLSLGISCGAAAALLAFALRYEFQWPAVGYTLTVILLSRLSLVSSRFAKRLLPVTAIGGVVMVFFFLLDRL